MYRMHCMNAYVFCQSRISYNYIYKRVAPRAKTYIDADLDKAYPIDSAWCGIFIIAWCGARMIYF